MLNYGTVGGKNKNDLNRGAIAILHFFSLVLFLPSLSLERASATTVAPPVEARL